MNTLPPEERERLRALYEKATPGEWRLCDPQEHPWRVGPIEPQRQDTVTIVNDSGYGIMCFPTEIGSGHTRDFELLIALHNSFPSILHTLEMVDDAKDTIERISESLPEPFTCHKRADITGIHIIDDVRDLVKEFQKTQENEQAYSKQVRALTDERDSLQAWKDSAMQVEREWDAQKVGKLLKLPLGSSIKAGIEPAIVELIDERDSLRAELAASKERELGLREALIKLHGYNAAIIRGHINYRPEDHLEVAEKALSAQPTQSPWRPEESLMERSIKS